MATMPEARSLQALIARVGAGLRSATALVGEGARRFGFGRIVRNVPVAMIIVTATTWAADAKRLALVVGNDSYENVETLKNATNDAKDLAQALSRLDFEVTLLTDANDEDFWARFDGFVTEAEDAESVLFFYSGHAFQLGGANYLVPTDAQLSSRAAIEQETWRLDDIVKKLSARNRQTLIFLDACRNNPLPESMRDANTQGLAQMEKGSGTFIAFATQPNNVTVDGTGENSPFTQALLNYIEEPGISISDLMIRVRNDVESETFGRQTPWDQSSLRAQFYFNPQVERSAELTDADYEVIAALDPDTRKRLLAALGNSGTNILIEEVEDEVEKIQEAVERVGIIDVEELGKTKPEIAPAPVVFGDPVIVAGGTKTDSSAVVVIGGEPAPDRVASSGKNLTRVDGNTVSGAVVLAALSPTSALTPVTDGRSRIIGQEILRDSEEAIAVGIAPEASRLEGEELAAALQTELARLGCYRMSIDGDWGKGSRVSLFRYLAARKIVSDELEPSNALLNTLRSDEEVACKAVQQVSSKSARKAISTVRTASAQSKKSSGSVKTARKSAAKKIKTNYTTTRTRAGQTEKTITKRLNSGVFR